MLPLAVRHDKIRRETCPATDHLPEFRLRTHLLEKDQIHALRHIDPRIHHIHRHRDDRILIRILEICDQRLRIRIITDDATCEMPMVLWIHFIKTVHNELRVLFILRKNDRLPQPIPARDLDALLHQSFNDRPHRIPVEDLPIYLRLRYIRGETPIILDEILLIPLPILRRELIIRDSLMQEKRLHFIILIRHEEMRCDRLLITIGIRRYSQLSLEEIIRIPIHIRLRRRREPHQDRIEIIENRPILFENAPMALIDDDQIEMRRREKPRARLRPPPIDGIQHRRIRREDDTRIRILLIAAQIAQRHLRKIRLESLLRLRHQSRPIRQKKHPRDPIAAQKHIHQRRRRARLPRPRRHHQEMLPPASLDFRKRRTDRLLLVRAIRDPVIDRDRRQRLWLLRPPLHQPRQVLLTEDPAHLPRRPMHIIPEMRLKPIRQKNERPRAIHLFQRIRIELGLLRPRLCIPARPLRLHHRERPSILPEKHIIRLPHSPRDTIHIADRELGCHIRPQARKLPASELKIHIDIHLPRRQFRDRAK